jgi:hypothetical protein
LFPIYDARYFADHWDWDRSGLAVEQEVRADSIEDGEECWLSSGVRGFFFGKVKLNID